MKILDSRLNSKTSAGKDGLDIKCLIKTRIRALAKLYTMWLQLGWVPQIFLDSRTIFIPKGSDVDVPSDLRPISISSVFLRQFQKIRNKCLLSVVKISPQFGFQSMDGIANAVSQLDSVFAYFKTNFSSCASAFIDLKKAFHSVNHSAIYNALTIIGVPLQFVSYIKYVYQHARTFLCFNKQKSEAVLPARGVRQGDPLFSTIFLIVLDFVLREISIQLGAHISNNNKISYLHTQTIFYSWPTILPL